MRFNFPPPVLIRAASIAFTCPGLGIRFGLARSSARLGSGWVRLDSGLVSFLNSGHKDSNRLDSRLRSVRSGRISSMLGSAELGARLGAQFGAKLGIGWGLRDS